jgi:hypothetical protein
VICPRYPACLLSACPCSSTCGSLTNDRRYDSKDSRDIEKGSLSDMRLRWLEDVVEVGVLCQKLFFSVGDGFFKRSAERIET